ncbi:MAG: hypothetical protein IKO84_11605 [Butyrivibrio sp.]|nr:hypothetical protein [Butyrivibrio sp.]
MIIVQTAHFGEEKNFSETRENEFIIYEKSKQEKIEFFGKKFAKNKTKFLASVLPSEIKF